MYSGDWAGYAQESIEQEFPDSIALVSIGCGSDSNPTSGVTGDRVEMARDQGQQIGAEVRRLMGVPGRKLSAAPVSRHNLIRLPLNDLPSRAELEELAKTAGPASYNASWQLAKLDRGEELPTGIDYTVQSLTFGDQLHMVFLAGEVCVDYSLRLKKELNRDRLWVNGYSNDFCCYIPSERLVQEGGYGGGGEIPYFALPATLKPGLEQLIIDEVRAQAGEVFLTPPGTHGIPPKSPEESIRLMNIHEDLVVELVAAEPLVADPVAIDFGSDGRMWVAEMPDYTRGVNEEFEQHGRIRFLTDDDRDGKFDRSTVFLTGLRFPTDVKVWRDGVLVCDAPEILFAADRDGDGIAEVREVVITGFATHNPHARVNSLRLGLDGWLYGSGGLFGGKIRTPNGKEVETSGRDFRFHADSGTLEPAAGQTQQGRTRDDFDNWFGCTNGALLLHYPYDERYTARTPDIAPPTSIVSVPSAAHGQRLFPPSNLVLFSNSGPPGRPTSACGAEIYRDRVLGDEYYGDAFVCEPVNQLVHRIKMRRNEEGGFTGDRPENELGREFLTSGDQWFRPVQVRTGTDGALYVVDMYRFVIEHPQWLSDESRAGLDVSAGSNLGRIYKICPRPGSIPAIPRIDSCSNLEIAKLSDSENGPLRDLVQQELNWRDAGGPDVDRILESTARTSTWNPAKVQAAAMLAGRETLSDDLAVSLLGDTNTEVQQLMIRITEERLAGSSAIADTVVSLIENARPELLAQIAFSIRDMPPSRLVPALSRIVMDSRTALTRYAVLSSLPREYTHELYRHCIQAGKPLSVSFCQSLIDLASNDPVASLKLVSQILNLENGEETARRWQLIAHWVERAPVGLPEGADETIGQVHHAADDAIKVLRTEEADDSLRVAAMELAVAVATCRSPELARPMERNDWPILGRLLTSLHSPEVQAASLGALARLTPAGQPPLFFEYWNGASPRLRSQMVDQMLSRKPWPEFLAARLADNGIRWGDLNATQRESLAGQISGLGDPAGQVVLHVEAGARSQILADWQDALHLKGDVEKGRVAYVKHCAACHLLDGGGYAVGPDLAALTNPTPQSWFVAILDPNRDIDGRYLNYVAVTRDGLTLGGLIAEETSASVTLKEREGKTHVLLRQDLDEFRSANKSMMPEGMENDLGKQELADLITWLSIPRTPPKLFAGNRPETVLAGPGGAIELGADTASLYGTDVVFESESPFRNIGYWSGPQDHVIWRFETADTGRFDVYLEYACDPGSAGNRASISAGVSQLDHTVESTGAWSQYRVFAVGTIDIDPGANSLRVGFGGPRTAHSLFDLKRIVLCREGQPLPAGLAVESR